MLPRRDTDPSVRSVPISEAPLAAFGAPETWPPELVAGVQAVRVNPTPTALWWGLDAPPFHNPAAAPLLSGAVLEQLVPMLDVARATTTPASATVVVPGTGQWAVQLRGVADAEGVVQGVLLVAMDLGDVVAGYEMERQRSEIHAANLEAALASNRQIGTAIGILMAHRRITEDGAFELLREVSQRQHRKLRAVADDVILTGTIQD
ncbi:ANTAR domain-containing protein [Jatrophihabitans sp.]|uniref:ANTAR domain-containing protein n=1 Tax=Jatrophihabitans sp. TaxID=1932789 RepID=UPI0030C66EC1|nr:hypothetical protein [Jatrophihabitans sp.]